MTQTQWKIFNNFRNELKSYCKKWNEEYGQMLIPLQIASSKNDTPEYPHETQVVYNTALDELDENSEIKLIVIGDNPGKDEQLSKNQKYLVGQSGKIAAGFFKSHPELETDFRKNAIILNKTPIHTAKTKHLKILAKDGGEKIAEFIQKSQIFMAETTAKLHIDLCDAAKKDGGTVPSSYPDNYPELWLVGYSELKKNRIFTLYKEKLAASYESNPEIWEKVFVFQHFSMNRFSIDLKDFSTQNPGKNLLESIHCLGKLHREEIFSGNA